MRLEIVKLESPEAEDRLAVLRPLVAHNDAAFGPSGFRQVAIVLKDETGVVVGGLWAKASFGWLYVELLAVPDAARGRGLGSELVRRADDEARGLGCRGVWVDCFGPENRSFYEKLGFRVFGAIPDHPEGVERVFLSKKLEA